MNSTLKKPLSTHKGSSLEPQIFFFLGLGIEVYHRWSGMQFGQIGNPTSSNHRWMNYYPSILPASFPLMPEALAMREAHISVRNLGLNQITFESDCQNLIHACQGGLQKWEIDPVISDIGAINNSIQIPEQCFQLDRKRFEQGVLPVVQLSFISSFVSLSSFQALVILF